MRKLIGVEFFKLCKRWMPYVLLLALLAITLLPIVLDYTDYQNRYQSAIDKYPELEDVIKEVEVGHGGNSGITVYIDQSDPQNSFNVTPDEEWEKEHLVRQLSNAKESLVLPWAMDGIFSSIPGLGMFLAAFLTASVIGAEYGWGTLRQTLAKGTSRSNYLTAKLLAISIAIIGGVLVVVLVGFIATLITSMLVHGGMEWSGFAGHFFAPLGRTLLILAVYMAMAAFFAVLLRSSAAGLAVVVVWLIAETIIIGFMGNSTGWLAEVPNYLIGTNTNELLSLNSFNPPDDIKPWWQSCGILLAYITVFITAACYFFRRQDLTA